MFVIVCSKIFIIFFNTPTFMASFSRVSSVVLIRFVYIVEGYFFLLDCL